MIQKSVGVFLSSSERVSASFQEEAYRLGQTLAKSGFKVVYGGANCGCMGLLAKGVLEAGGLLTGVIPEIDLLAEVAQENLSEKFLVKTMGERKEKMMALSDAFIAFPGGIGTLDEITDVLCGKSIHHPLVAEKPFVFFNHLDFWTPFLESLEIMEQAMMLSRPLDQMYQVYENLNQVVDYLK